jgi:hypothetical protein
VKDEDIVPVGYYLSLGPPPKIERGQLIRAAKEGVPLDQLSKWVAEDSKGKD